jgi:hypothetical protein
MAEKVGSQLQDENLSSDYSSHDEVASEFTVAEQRAILHKIDRRLVVLVGFMYCVSLMDRSNLSNAKVAGEYLYRTTLYYVGLPRFRHGRRSKSQARIARTQPYRIPLCSFVK